MSRETLLAYRMRELGSISIKGDTFSFNVEDARSLEMTCAIYAFLIGEEIVRIGSSKSPLRHRFRAWQNDVSRALAGQKSPTPFRQAEEFRTLLEERPGAVFARPGTMVWSSIGEFNAYLAEEKALIERHTPRFSKR